MKEPEISVGIVNAQEIHFSLNGNFFAKGETVCGETPQPLPLQVP